jgi:hypothetical protein
MEAAVERLPCRAILNLNVLLFCCYYSLFLPWTHRGNKQPYNSYSFASITKADDFRLHLDYQQNLLKCGAWQVPLVGLPKLAPLEESPTIGYQWDTTHGNEF